MRHVVYAIIFLALARLSLANNLLVAQHPIQYRTMTLMPDNKFITNFSWKLFSSSKLDNPESNHVMSPISAQLCLAVLQQTAAGETKQQFDKVLGIHSPQIISDALVNMQQSHSLNELHSATAMFPMINYVLNETFTQNAQKSSVKIVPVNFKDFNPTEQTINAWVSEATRGEIPRIIEPDEDLSDVRLLLANSIYFHGKWNKEFNEELEDGDFHTKSTDSMKVKYMKMHTGLKYGEHSLGRDNLGYRWIELPYKNDEFSMFVVMPTQRWGLEAMVKAMNENDLERMMDQDHSKGYWSWPLVNLSLPKFSIKTKISLTDTLKQLGLNDVFDEGKSELPYLTADGKKLYISKAIQQATLNVDLKGTVASAVTSVYVAVAQSGAFYSNRLDFIVDQPFLSVIVDRKQNIPIFISKIYTPEIIN